MATIYPDNLSKDILDDPLRKGEIKLFEALKKSKLFSTCKIYYSADWINKGTKKDRQRDGECDFIITDKDYGVLFIEVKGGQISKDENNQWYSGNQKIKNPIKQCNKNMYSFMEEYKRRWKSKRLGDNFPSFFHDSFAFFPDVDYKNNQYLGAAYDKNKFGFKKDLESIEEKILSFFNEGRKVTGLFEELGQESQDIFHEMFTKPFSFKQSLKDEIRDNSLSISKLTAEQFEILDGAHKDWKTLWCEGPAGSGKTIIAINKFLKEYSYQENSNFLFLCKNKLISEKVKDKITSKIEDSSKNSFFIGTFDGFCQSILGSHGSNLDFSNLEKSYESVFDVISNTNSKYDVIVIDESQDFSNLWWTIIESLRKEDTILWIFGDSNQKIWKKRRPDISEINPTSVYLTHVLRNSKTIAQKSLAFFDGGGHELTLDGPISNKFDLISTSDFSRSIVEIHKKLIFEGVANESIIVLSSDKSLKEQYKDINFSSIYEFKGMEADCVIFAIENLDKYESEHLYVGITRAKTFLNILCKPEEEEEILKLLI